MTRPAAVPGITAVPSIGKARDADTHPAVASAVAPPPPAMQASERGEEPRRVVDLPREALSTRVPAGYNKAMKRAAVDLDLDGGIQTVVTEGIRLWFAAHADSTDVRLPDTD